MAEEEREVLEPWAAVAAAFEAKRRGGERGAEEGKERVEEGMSVWWSIEWLPKSVPTTNAPVSPRPSPFSHFTPPQFLFPPFQIFPLFFFSFSALGAYCFLSLIF